MDTVICLRMGKTYMAKTPRGDFKVTTLENPLLSQQVVTSKVIGQECIDPCDILID